MHQKDNPKLPLPAFFLNLEKQVWDALVKGDAQADAALLSIGFLGLYPSGFSDRAGHAGQLADGPVMQRYQLDQIRLVAAGGNHALLCYRARYLRAGADRDEVMYVSSLWGREGDRWLNSFSQDTPAG